MPEACAGVLGEKANAAAARKLLITVRYSIVNLAPVYLRSVQDDHVINHPQIASAYVINKHASARFDRGLDDSS